MGQRCEIGRLVLPSVRPADARAMRQPDKRATHAMHAPVVVTDGSSCGKFASRPSAFGRVSMCGLQGNLRNRRKHVHMNKMVN